MVWSVEVVVGCLVVGAVDPLVQHGGPVLLPQLLYRGGAQPASRRPPWPRSGGWGQGWGPLPPTHHHIGGLGGWGRLRGADTSPLTYQFFACEATKFNLLYKFCETRQTQKFMQCLGKFKVKISPNENVYINKNFNYHGSKNILLQLR